MWMVSVNEVNGLFSINGTVQGENIFPNIHKLDLKFLGSLVTLLSCVSKYVAVLLLRYHF